MAACSEALCETRNWADVPRELLCLILDRLVLIPDYVRFGAVCKSWQSVTRDQQQERSKSCHRQPPMLVIPDDLNHGHLYSICEQKHYPQRLQIPFHMRCCGSSYGWLAFPEKENKASLSITLLNPFSGKKTRLPTIIPTLDTQIDFYYFEYFLHKVVLSCDPSLYPKDWIAVAIHGRPKVLAFIKAGESSWTYPSNAFFHVKDACFCQGKLYAVNVSYGLACIDLSGKWGDGTRGSTIDSIVRYPSPVVDFYTGTYLVELDQDLLLVFRVFSKILDVITTVGFKVQKLCRRQPYDSTKAMEWVEMQDLGLFSLFLGINGSVSISTYDFENCKPNCIYYLDKCQGTYAAPSYKGDEEMGIFDLTTGEISRFRTQELWQGYKPPAVWILPKLGSS